MHEPSAGELETHLRAVSLLRRDVLIYGSLGGVMFLGGVVALIVQVVLKLDAATGRWMWRAVISTPLWCAAMWTLAARAWRQLRRSHASFQARYPGVSDDVITISWLLRRIDHRSTQARRVSATPRS